MYDWHHAYTGSAPSADMSDDDGDETTVVNLQSREDVDWLADARDKDEDAEGDTDGQE
jgi:hypothetical protein